MLKMADCVIENIKATDLPEFENLQKDERFGEILKNYKIEALSQKIKEFKKDESPL